MFFGNKKLPKNGRNCLRKLLCLSTVALTTVAYAQDAAQPAQADPVAPAETQNPTDQAVTNPADQTTPSPVDQAASSEASQTTPSTTTTSEQNSNDNPSNVDIGLPVRIFDKMPKTSPGFYETNYAAFGYSRLQVGFKLGGGIENIKTTVKRTKLITEDLAFSFGSSLLSAFGLYDISRRWSVGAFAEGLFDYKTQQIIKRSGGALFHINLLGGAKNLVTDNKYFTKNSNFKYALSLVLSPRYDNYYLYIPQEDSDAYTNISGSTVGIYTGLNYRLDISRSSALGFEGLVKVYSINLSGSKLTIGAYQFSGIWSILL